MGKRGVKASQPASGQNNIVSFFDRQRQLTQHKAPSLAAAANRPMPHPSSSAHLTSTSPLTSDSLANQRSLASTSPAAAPQHQPPPSVPAAATPAPVGRTHESAAQGVGEESELAAATWMPRNLTRPVNTSNAACTRLRSPEPMIQMSQDDPEDRAEVAWSPCPLTCSPVAGAAPPPAAGAGRSLAPALQQLLSRPSKRRATRAGDASAALQNFIQAPHTRPASPSSGVVAMLPPPARAPPSTLSSSLPSTTIAGLTPKVKGASRDATCTPSSSPGSKHAKHSASNAAGRSKVVLDLMANIAKKVDEAVVCKLRTREEGSPDLSSTLNNKTHHSRSAGSVSYSGGALASMLRSSRPAKVLPAESVLKDPKANGAPASGTPPSDPASGAPCKASTPPTAGTLAEGAVVAGDGCSATRLSSLGSEQLQATGATGVGKMHASTASGEASVRQRRESRFTVREVASFVQDNIMCTQEETVLLLQNEFNQEHIYLHCLDSWHYTPVHPGDTLHVIWPGWGMSEHDAASAGSRCSGNCGPFPCRIVDDTQGLIILHPDILLPATSVGGSFQCLRRSVLDQAFGGGEASVHTLLGSLLHHVFQTAISAQPLPREEDLHACATRALASHASSTVEVAAQRVTLNTTLEEAVRQVEHELLEKMHASVPGLHQWAKEFRGERARAAVNLKRQGAFSTSQVGKMRVLDVMDIEENIWSPLYGLKGQIDSSLVVDLEDDALGPRVMPLELKTGARQSVHEHNAQLSLYLLLMADRYHQHVAAGMLHYSNASIRDTSVVWTPPFMMRSILIKRNELAAAVRLHSHNPAHLPEPVAEPRICQRCTRAGECAALHRVLQGGAGVTADGHQAGMVHALEAQSHMSSEQQRFLAHWENLLTLESSATLNHRSQLWSLASEERMQLGTCLGGMVLCKDFPRAERGQRGAGGEARWLYSLRREDGAATEQCSIFVPGAHLVMSTECGHVAVARGVVHSVTPTTITLSLRRELVLSTGPPVEADSSAQRRKTPFEVRWRLDKDESTTMMGRLRSNVIRLVTDSTQEVSKLRRLVVDLEPPCFSLLPAPDCISDEVGNLNSDQQAALHKALSVHDYCLILGMPGTGKTFVICQLVKEFVARGKSVLLSSFTNSAVDNILSRLVSQKVPFLRLGQEGSVAADVLPFTLGGPNLPVDSASGLAACASTASVVACTCHGIGHSLFATRRFDVCIVDEAGQMTLPAALGPLLHANTFVLVGDHHQLPPLVANEEARSAGADISLFKRLCTSHPDAVAELAVQHRMADDIMLLSNTLVYSGRLRAASRQVGASLLPISPAPPSFGCSEWLREAINPERRVMFLDTDPLGDLALQQQAGKVTCNPMEARILVVVARALHEAGLPGQDIGALSPYNAQIALFQHLAQEMNVPGLDCITIDRSQGRDWPCVIVSMVRSNKEQDAGPLLGDLRRINVSLTRPKSKLILIGSSSTLKSQPHLQDLLCIIREHNWLFPVPEEALVTDLQHISADMT